MSHEARVRIDSHRLMKAKPEAYADERVSSSRNEIETRKQLQRAVWKKRTKLHLGIFSLTFIFTMGVFTLGVLLWVEPDELLPLVLVALVSAIVFVACFAWLRMFILHKLLPEPVNKEEDPGMTYHFSKSVSYGFVALVGALVLAGFIMNIASANIL
jgi:hypothetical protein